MNKKNSGHCEGHRNSHGTHKDVFPLITDGEWHTQNGNVFKWNEKYQCWKQIEAYLAATPIQYNCKSYEEQFKRLQRVLGDKLHPVRYRTDDNNWTMISNHLSRTRYIDKV